MEGVIEGLLLVGVATEELKEVIEEFPLVGVATEGLLQLVEGVIEELLLVGVATEDLTTKEWVRLVEVCILEAPPPGVGVVGSEVIGGGRGHRGEDEEE